MSGAALRIGAGSAPDRRPEPARLETAELGMWVFLATEVLFFGALFVAYGFGRVEHAEGWALAARHTDVVLGTLNTAILLTSSAFVAAAVAAVEHDHSALAARCLWIAVALGVAFAAIKGLEWQHEWRDGLFPGPRFALAGTPGAELFFVVYFVVTALHAVHLVIGIGLMATFAVGTGRGSAFARPPHLQVAALYWHFVDVVWIFLYPLLYLVARNG